MKDANHKRRRDDSTISAGFSNFLGCETSLPVFQRPETIASPICSTSNSSNAVTAAVFGRFFGVEIIHA
ncbi:MAG: hypothetical protein AB7V46_03065, partial [Thermomicrobiales bacterium]